MEHYLQGGEVRPFLPEEGYLGEKFGGTHLGGLAGGLLHLPGGEGQHELLPFEPEEGVHLPFGCHLEDLAVLKPPLSVLPEAVLRKGDAAEPPLVELLDDHILHDPLPGLQFVQIDDPAEQSAALLPEKDLLLEHGGFFPQYLVFHEIFRRPV